MRFRHQCRVHPRKDLPGCDDDEARWVLSGFRSGGPQRLRHAGTSEGADAQRAFAPAPQVIQPRQARLRSCWGRLMAEFIHLRLHTEYSLIDSVVRVPELVDAAAAAGMSAVAVTDQNNLFAMVKFYRAALARGVKPIIGVDLLVRETGERQQPSRLTLLCQSQRGYRNITRLVSRAYLEGQQRGIPTVDRSWLSRETVDGLIALSCATEGDIGRALVNAREREAEKALDQWLDGWDNRLYI